MATTIPVGPAENADPWYTPMKAFTDAVRTRLNTELSDAALAETVRDTMGAALVAGSNVTITVDDPGDTITIAASGGGGGGLSGTGSPEGVVTATVGQTYTDTAATRGAILWVKTSGSGNTGWAVEYGDTGWRAIFNGADTGPGKIDKLSLRRFGTFVFFEFEGGPTMDAASALDLYSIPTGFQIQQSGAVSIVHSDGVQTGTWFAWNGNMLRLTTTAGAWRKGGIIGVTAQPWPTSLPGTPL